MRVNEWEAMLCLCEEEERKREKERYDGLVYIEQRKELIRVKKGD